MALTQFSTSKFINVTKSDTADLEYQGDKMATKYISCEVTGDIAVWDDEGTAVTLQGLTQGILHPIVTQRIMSTNTAATGINAYF